MTDVTYERKTGAIGVITMSRLPANTYETTFVHGLDEAIELAEADDGCKVVILRSAAKGFFCGGVDIKQVGMSSPSANMEMISFAQETLNKPSRSRRIYIAEIAGHALGGGLEIALSCDVRFAATGKYLLGLPEVTLGLLPGNGGTQRLPALLGAGRALELMITGNTIGPEEAHRLGLLNRLVPPESLSEEAEKFAQSLCRGASQAIALVKRSVYDGYQMGSEAGYTVERANLARLFKTADAYEGFASFTEKRKPNFTGR